jgi:phosphonoacetaldehyde hydrolase
MSYSHLKAVVFDWAGTVIDFGSHAPMGAFVRLFEQFGVSISIEEARQPMGLPKWDHIKALGSQPRIANTWQAVHGQAFSDADVDRLYDIFTPMNAASVKEHAELVPGVSALMLDLRAAGLKIGSTTGYNRPIAEVMAPLAAAQGFQPDNMVCADDLPVSRPSPMAMYRTFIDLGVWPARSVVKVDDTAPGLAEGTQAGCWTVAVLASGNAMGLSASEWDALEPEAKQSARDKAMKQLTDAQPHYWVDTVADLRPVLREIEQRLDRGERPAIA